MSFIFEYFFGERFDDRLQLRQNIEFQEFYFYFLRFDVSGQFHEFFSAHLFFVPVFVHTHLLWTINYKLQNINSK